MLVLEGLIATLPESARSAVEHATSGTPPTRQATTTDGRSNAETKSGSDPARGGAPASPGEGTMAASEAPLTPSPKAVRTPKPEPSHSPQPMHRPEPTHRPSQRGTLSRRAVLSHLQPMALPRRIRLPRSDHRISRNSSLAFGQLPILGQIGERRRDRRNHEDVENECDEDRDDAESGFGCSLGCSLW